MLFAELLLILKVFRIKYTFDSSTSFILYDFGIIIDI